jgi:SAM-dependent methyltransferase
MIGFSFDALLADALKLDAVALGTLVLGGVMLLVLLVPLAKKLTSPKPDYGQLSFWERRYRMHPDAYEWFVDYATIAGAGFLTESMLEIDELKFLEVGCGNSTLSEQMWEASGKKADITAIDFSDTCIDLMKMNFPLRADKYLCMDGRDMEFKEGSFDVVVDKGTLDALTASKTEAAIHNGRRVAKEIARVVKPGGTFVTISCTAPTKWAESLGLQPQFSAFMDKQITAQCGKTAILVYVQSWKRTTTK